MPRKIGISIALLVATFSQGLGIAADPDQGILWLPKDKKIQIAAPVKIHQSSSNGFIAPEPKKLWLPKAPERRCANAYVTLVPYYDQKGSFLVYDRSPEGRRAELIRWVGEMYAEKRMFESMRHLPDTTNYKVVDIRNQDVFEEGSVKDAAPTRLFSLKDGRNGLTIAALDENVAKWRPAPFGYLKYGSKGLTISGVNSTEAIREARSINGVLFEELDKRGIGSLGTTGSPNSSDVGYIMPWETVREWMVRDNISVVDENHLSHQIVNAPFLSAMQALETACSTGPVRPYVIGHLDFRKPLSGWASRDAPSIRLPHRVLFRVNGEDYAMDLKGIGSVNGATTVDPRSGWVDKDTQGTIFDDSIYANYEFIVTKLSTGERMWGNPLTVHMGYRYGFYQGGPYRMDPERSIRFFGLAPGK